MKMKRLIAMALVSVMVLSAAGCGGKTENAGGAASDTEAAADTQGTEAEQETEADAEAQTGENPILQYEGAYADENGSGVYLLFEATDEIDGVSVSIGYPEETAYTYWEITGRIKDNVITYEDAFKFSMDWGTPDQEEVTEEMIYNDGSGTFEISQDARVTWKDNKEDAGNGMVFVWDDEMNEMIREEQEQMAYGDFDSQNPVVNWAGPYADANNKNRTMQIESGGEDAFDCTIIVLETNSTTKSTAWYIPGVFDEESMTISYADCVKIEETLDAEGNTVSEETIYEDGTGTFIIDAAEQTITWSDDKEDAGNGSLFTFMYDYGDAGISWTGEPAAEAP